MTCLVFEHRHILDADEPESLLYRSPLLETFLNATVDGLFLLSDQKEPTRAPDSLSGPGTLYGHPLRFGDVMCDAGVTGAGTYRQALLTLARKLTLKEYLDDAVGQVASAIQEKGEAYLAEIVPGPAAAPA